MSGSLKDHLLEVDGVTWFHREAGPAEAPAVVLVHGLSISSAYMAPLGERLVAEGFRVLAPDLPGFGRSAAPAQHQGIAQMADALARWMDFAGVPRAHLLANSLGCQVLAALAVTHPARVDRLVLVGPPAEEGVGMREMAARLARDALREKPRLLWLHARDDLRAGPQRIWRAARASMDEDIHTWASGVEPPTLILRGSEDPILPAHAARRLARRMRRAIVREIHGAPHAANYSAPDEVAAAILPFLQGRDPAFPAAVPAAPRQRSSPRGA